MSHNTVAAGIIEGDAGAGTLRPKGSVSRAEIAAIVQRVIEYLVIPNEDLLPD